MVCVGKNNSKQLSAGFCRVMLIATVVVFWIKLPGDQPLSF